MKTRFFKIILSILMILPLISCHRNDADEDDFPQEEISNILLILTDQADNSVKTVNYQVNASTNPTIHLQNGHVYDVRVLFKNGAEDATEDIITAKNEHFLVYNFPNSDIGLVRTDGPESTHDLPGDNAKVGLRTTWTVNNAANNGNAKLILTLYHNAVSVSENANPSGTGMVYGTHTGGETDAEATFNISN